MNPNQATEAKPTKNQLYYEAFAAYVKANKVCDDWPAMPTRVGTSISFSRVILRNGKYFLAIYDVKKKELLKSKNGMKKYAIPARTNQRASGKQHLVARKNEIDTMNHIGEGVETYSLIKIAIDSYNLEYTLPGRQLIKPGLNSSEVQGDRVLLRSGNVLLAIYRVSTGRFIPLTKMLIQKYSK